MVTAGVFTVVGGVLIMTETASRLTAVGSI